MRAGLIGFALLLGGCPSETQLRVTTDPLTIEAEISGRDVLDAHMPTDLRVLPDGGYVVLDGYRGRALVYDAAGQQTAQLGDPLVWGQPTRMVDDGAGGWWLAAPATDLDAGALLQVDGAGELVRILVPIGLPDDAPPFSPVALARVGDQLAVADRSGAALWVSTTTGAVAGPWDSPDETSRFGVWADLVTREDGGVWGVDAIQGSLFALGPQGPIDGAVVGRTGFQAGTLYRPKSVDRVDGALIVVDSALGVIQIFGEDGAFRGVVSDGEGEPLRFTHPIAVRAVPGDGLLVLDAATHEVVHLALDPADITRVPDPEIRHLRTNLISPASDDPTAADSTCIHCHDGFVNDDRANWDPSLGHHPRTFDEPHKVPVIFPVTESGDFTCGTCHSPHGTVTAEVAASIEGAAELAALTRTHAATGDGFSRVEPGDGGLCRACHGATPHEDAAAKLDLPVGAHPTGSALIDALADRSSDEGDATDADCQACHSPHAARGEPLLRDATSATLCAGCHEDQAISGQNHPLARRPGSDVSVDLQAARLAEVREGELGCRTCHDLLNGEGASLLRHPDEGGLLCLSCHLDKAEVLRGGHDAVRGHDGIVCLSCHDVHGRSPDRKLLATTSKATRGDPTGCVSCHAPTEKAAPGVRGHPVNGAALDGGDKLTCESCHAAHDPTAPDASTCEACHAEQSAAHTAGGHGTADCLDCHPAHSDAPKPPKAQILSNPSAARCLACHDERAPGNASKVASFKHPTPAFLPDGQRWQPLGSLPLFDDAGEPVASGENGALVCQSCHTVHGPEAGSADHLRRDGWKEVCSSCHGADALLLYRYFHDPERWPDVSGGAP